MRPIRVQYKLGSLMATIAIFALGFAYPRISVAVLIMIGLLLANLALFAAMLVPSLFLLDRIDRWLDAREAAARRRLMERHAVLVTPATGCDGIVFLEPESAGG